MSDESKYVYEGENEIQAAIDAGRALGEPRELEHELAVYSVTVPKDATHQLVRVPAPNPDFESAPDRPRGTYRPATVEALISVIERHHDPKATTVWVHPTSGRVIAVFNDHAPDGPAWRDHRAQLDLTITPEWKHWASKDGVQMGQMVFAEHIEDGLTEIAEPPAADLLELAQTFEAHQTASFRSATRLHDGTVQFQYDEELDAKAGRSGQMKIPTEFKLLVPPFLGEERRPLTARLRYRIPAGKLTLGYILDAPDVVIRDTLNAIAEKLAAKFPSVFVGKPED